MNQAATSGVKTSHYIGFDVGHRNDPSGLVVVSALGDTYRVRHVREIRNVSFENQLRTVQVIGARLETPVLVLDSTGIGAAVAEWARDLVGFRAVIGYVITGGNSIGARTVSKSHLLGQLQAIATQGRIIIPDRPETMKLRHQMTTWTVEENQGRFKAVNDRQNKSHHYDLATALALVITHHERHRGLFQ